MDLWFYKAKVDRVIDGDTVDFMVDLGFNVWKKVRVRLAGLDTPEIYGVKHGSEEHVAGVAATEYVEDWFDGHDFVYIQTEKNTGKYGRWIGTIWTLNEDAVLNEDLLKSGHAVPVEY